MRNFIILFFSSLILFTGCEMDERTLDLNTEFQLKKGKTYEFGSYKIKLKNIEDSRCPANANCIWAGEAKVSFEIKDHNKSESFILSTHEKHDYIFQNYQIKLLNVAPYPETGKEIEGDDYRIAIKIMSASHKLSESP